MDLKSIRNTVKADESISVIERFLIVALAVGMFREGAKNKVSICDLARQCNVSPRTIKRAIAHLRRAGVVSVSADGKANVYKLHSAMIIGDTVSPIGGNNGDTVSPYGDTVSPIGGVYKGVEVKESNIKSVCEKSRGRVCARAHTHAREFDFDAAGLAADLNLPLAYVAECVKKWGAADWVTTQGKQITPKTIRAHLLAFWQNEKDKAAYTKPPKPARKHTAKEVADAKALCAENCANFKGGKCGAGVATLPALLNPPRPPQECKHFNKS